MAIPFMKRIYIKNDEVIELIKNSPEYYMSNPKPNEYEVKDPCFVLLLVQPVFCINSFQTANPPAKAGLTAFINLRATIYQALSATSLFFYRLHYTLH